MFDVGFWEILFIMVLALLVLGPKRLPGVVNKVGAWAGKARYMARSLRVQIERELEADMAATPQQPAAKTAAKPAAQAAASASKTAADPEEGTASESDASSSGQSGASAPPTTPSVESADPKDERRGTA